MESSVRCLSSTPGLNGTCRGAFFLANMSFTVRWFLSGGRCAPPRAMALSTAGWPVLRLDLGLFVDPPQPPPPFPFPPRPVPPSWPLNPPLYPVWPLNPAALLAPGCGCAGGPPHPPGWRCHVWFGRCCVCCVGWCHCGVGCWCAGWLDPASGPFLRRAATIASTSTAPSASSQSSSAISQPMLMHPHPVLSRPTVAACHRVLRSSIRERIALQACLCLSRLLYALSTLRYGWHASRVASSVRLYVPLIQIMGCHKLRRCAHPRC